MVDSAIAPKMSGIKKTKATFKVNKDIDSLLPPLSDEELKALDESIRLNGVRDPILIWKETNVIVEGHNRYRTAKKYKQIFPFRYVYFDSIDEVLRFAIANQFSRRNLTPVQRQYFIGKKYEELKQSHGGQKRGISQNDISLPTTAIVAAATGTSPATVSRAAEVAKVIDAASSEDKAAILAGKKPVPKTVRAKPKKSGSILFKIAELHDLCGKCERLIDKLARAYGIVNAKDGTVKTTPETEGLRRSLREWKKHFEAEQKRLEKSYLERLANPDGD